MLTPAQVAVTGYSSTDNVITLKAVSGATYGTADMSLKDAKVLFADTKNKTGIEGGEIALAEASANGGYKANALALYADSKLKLLIVDSSNLLNGTETATGFTVTAAALASSYPGWTIATDKAKAVEGETVTVTITSNGTGTETSAAITVTGAGATVASPVTLTASTAKSYTIPVTMGTANITAISVTLS